MTILDKLHEIERCKYIDEIKYCYDGCAFKFYDPCKSGKERDKWGKFYSTFEIAVETEYKILIQESYIENTKNLTPRERKILELRFGLNGNNQYTIEEVGREFGVTRERIKQIQQKALLKIKNYEKNNTSL